MHKFSHRSIDVPCSSIHPLLSSTFTIDHVYWLFRLCTYYGKTCFQCVSRICLSSVLCRWFYSFIHKELLVPQSSLVSSRPSACTSLRLSQASFRRHYPPRFLSLVRTDYQALSHSRSKLASCSLDSQLAFPLPGIGVRSESYQVFFLRDQHLPSLEQNLCAGPPSFTIILFFRGICHGYIFV